MLYPVSKATSQAVNAFFDIFYVLDTMKSQPSFYHEYFSTVLLFLLSLIFYDFAHGPIYFLRKGSISRGHLEVTGASIACLYCGLCYSLLQGA